MSKNDWLFLGGMVIFGGAIAAIVKQVNPKCKWCGTAITLANAVSTVCPSCSLLVKV